MTNTSRKSTHDTRRARFIAAGVATLAVAGTIAATTTPTPASAEGKRAGVVHRDWLSYNAPNSQDREDTVKATFTRTQDPNSIQFVLSTAPDVTWWKGITITDLSSGRPLASDFTQDAKHTTGALKISRDAVQSGAYIAFSKAKEFGRHTRMYVATVPADQLGYRVDIHWLDD
jgi:hypothetical protein